MDRAVEGMEGEEVEWIAVRRAGILDTAVLGEVSKGDGEDAGFVSVVALAPTQC